MAEVMDEDRRKRDLDDPAEQGQFGKRDVPPEPERDVQNKKHLRTEEDDADRGSPHED